MKVDFNRLKTEISLPDFLLNLGWKFVAGSSNSCPKMSNGTHTIVIKRNAQNQYTYWDVHSDNVRGRTILDMMQEHLFETTGKQPTLREVGEILQNYINTNQIITPENSRYDVGNTSMSTDELTMYLKQLLPYKGNYLQKRGISEESIDSPVFKDVFLIREVKNKNTTYRNICVKMYNDKGVQAISQRNETFKGIIGGKFDCLATSNHDKSRPIDILYVGESIIDCISHYQLCHKDTSLNLVYVSTEGTLTEGQMQLLRIIISKNEVKSLRTIFDNDKQGYKYTLWLDNNLRGMQHDVEQMDSEVLKNTAYRVQNTEFPQKKDWNDDLKAATNRKRPPIKGGLFLHDKLSINYSQSIRIVSLLHNFSDRKLSLRHTFGKEDSLIHDFVKGLNFFTTSLSDGDIRITWKPTSLRFMRSDTLIRSLALKIYLDEWRIMDILNSISENLDDFSIMHQLGI